MSLGSNGFLILTVTLLPWFSEYQLLPVDKTPFLYWGVVGVPTISLPILAFGFGPFLLLLSFCPILGSFGFGQFLGFTSLAFECGFLGFLWKC